MGPKGWERINNRPNVKQSGAGVDVYRQLWRAVPRGDLGGPGLDTGLAEVRAEGVAKGVNVDGRVGVVRLRNTCAWQVAVEDIDEVARGR